MGILEQQRNQYPSGGNQVSGSNNSKRQYINLLVDDIIRTTTNDLITKAYEDVFEGSRGERNKGKGYNSEGFTRIGDQRYVQATVDGYSMLGVVDKEYGRFVPHDFDHNVWMQIREEKVRKGNEWEQDKEIEG